MSAEVWPSARPIGPGTVIAGRFKLGSELGAGGMGTVYRAEHLTLNRQVAVKVLHAHVATAPGAAERFQREARVLAQLNHPNAVHVYDFGSENGTLYIAMELLKGISLDELIMTTPGGLDLPRAAHICGQALDVLHVSHAMGVVHRDIKPANLFVEDPGATDRVKVVDFGLALVAEEPGKSRLTEMGMVHGTPEYMAPEQCLGQALDGRADIYAMGCVLWEMLVGAPPFGIGQAVQIMTSHVYKPLPSLREAAPEASITPAVEEVVRRALAKRQEDRFQTAHAMRDALAAAVQAPAEEERGASKTHERGARNGGQEIVTGDPTKTVGIWMLGPKEQQQGPGVAEAIVSAGFDVRTVNGDAQVQGMAVLVIVPAMGKDALESAGRIARIPGAPPVLLCGSDEDLAVITQAIENGVHDFVPLPLDATDLIKKVTRAVRKRVRSMEAAGVALTG